MVKRNLGYGRDGRGGAVADSTQGSTVNPNSGRGLSTQGSKPTPTAALPIVQASVATDEEQETGQYLFKAELNDTISCHEVTVVDQDDVEGGTNINVAKPPHLRKAEVDTKGETVNNEIVTYAPDELLNLQGTRKREFQTGTGGIITLFEKIDPPYLPNEKLFVAKVQSSGVPGIRFQDMNLQARQWINIEPDTKYFQVTAVNKDTLVCQEWVWTSAAAGGEQKKDAAGDLLPAVNVAKPWELRGSRWESKTISGVEYFSDDGTSETSGHTTRDGEGGVEEQQLIIPVYEVTDLPERSIIRATLVVGGTGAIIGIEETIWQDTNDAGRAWSEAFA